MEDSDTVTFKTFEDRSQMNDNDCDSLHGDNCSMPIENESPSIPIHDVIMSENAGDGEAIHNTLGKLISDLSSQVHQNFMLIKNEVRSSLTEFESKLDNMQIQIDNVHIRSKKSVSLPKDNSNQEAGSPDVITGRGPMNSTPNDINNNGPQMVIQNSHLGMSGDIPNIQLPYGPQYVNRQRSYHGNDLVNNKLKPQTYDGSDDLDEYLAQFNIVAELNNWSYTTKSLFLASSIVGNARAILCELDSEKRRDFDSIVYVLQNRYGSVHKAEIFRSRLQSRTLGRNETIPELAQSVRKLTRKAYPGASSEVVDLLALDYFVDAISDTDIRLRLREVGPKSISEAERIAVRLDAHKEADKSRGGRNYVRNVAPELSQTDRKINELSSQMKTLMAQVQGYRNKDRYFQRDNSYYHNGQKFANGGERANNYQRRNKSYQRGSDKVQSLRQNSNAGNESGSNSRTEIRHQAQGPHQSQ